MKPIDKSYVLNTLTELLSIDSPSGYTQEAMAYVAKEVTRLGYDIAYTRKGNGIVTVPGKSKEAVLGLSGHVDTLGAMVRSITDAGTLKFTVVGGPIVPTLDSEYCRIRTRDGKCYTGTFLSTAAAAHVHKEAGTQERTPDKMVVRLDERVTSKAEVQALGIGPGDFICIDTKTVIVNDFIKSRFLDDKASVACLLGVLKYLSDNAIQPEYETRVIFSTYEEVGHGAAHIPDDITALLAVDMGCIGEDLSCTEYDVSICAKDSSGPYDYDMTSELIGIAKDKALSYVVDIYPFYGSDVSAALRGGSNIKGALIGPGVHASHGMERTHYSALENTMALIIGYLKA